MLDICSYFVSTRLLGQHFPSTDVLAVTVKQLYQKIQNSKYGEIRLRIQRPACYENMAGFRLVPGPDMMSGTILLVTNYNDL